MDEALSLSLYQGSKGGLLFYLIQWGNKIMYLESPEIQEQRFWATTLMNLMLIEDRYFEIGSIL